ncbi:MAG: hypothetical protein OCC49_10390 [Fibrobacterales bacterium]
MIVKTITDIIGKIIEVERQKIDNFEIAINHAPTIGKQYEGVTRKLLNTTLPENSDFRIVSGFIKGGSKLSGQIDCMIVVGDGQLVPGTEDEFVYDLENVLMVVEVKKNLYSNDMSDAYSHLRDVVDLKSTYQALSAKETRILYNVFAKSTSKHITKYDEIFDLDETLQNIFHGLLTQFVLPLRIVIGYNGFASESSLRDKYYEFLEENMFQKGYGPFSYPDLIICKDSCLIKLNGEPYHPVINEGYLEFYMSCTNHNTVILTELILGRLSRFVDMDYGEDDSDEPLKPFLGAKLSKKGDKFGWIIRAHNYSPDRGIDSEGLEWKPCKVSLDAFAIFQVLCLRNVKLGEIKGKVLLQELIDTRLVATNDLEMTLTTIKLECCVMPDGCFYVGENKDGYFDRWASKVLKHSATSPKST